MGLLAQGARFYELLGYALAVLSVGILLTGVLWSLRVHVPKKHRTFFLVASLAVVGTLCGGTLALLVVSGPILPGTIDVQPPRQADQVSGPAGPTDHVRTIEVHAKNDGSVLFKGQTLTAEHLVSLLQREYPDEQLHFVIRIDAETKVAVAMTVINQLQQQGVERFSFHVND